MASAPAVAIQGMRKGQLPLDGFSGSPSGGGALTPGVITLVSAGNSFLSLSATDATGGTGPYTYQWGIALHGSGMYGSTCSGALTCFASHLVACTAYDVRLTYTDSLSNTVQAFLLNVMTTGCPPGGGANIDIIGESQAIGYGIIGGQD